MVCLFGNTTRRLIFVFGPAKAAPEQEIGMADVDGKWNCMVESPMGEQDFVLTVVSNGDRFSGSAVGNIGSKQIEDGSVEGDTLLWTMHISKPMPVTLACRATISGDSLEGKVKAGIFGNFPITGTRG
jgi:hypothetical protein